MFLILTIKNFYFWKYNKSYFSKNILLRNLHQKLQIRFCRVTHIASRQWKYQTNPFFALNKWISDRIRPKTLNAVLD